MEKYKDYKIKYGNFFSDEDIARCKYGLYNYCLDDDPNKKTKDFLTTGVKTVCPCDENTSSCYYVDMLISDNDIEELGLFFDEQDNEYK